MNAYFYGMKSRLLIGSLCGLVLVAGGNKLVADDSAGQSTRYGLFDALDHRSGYGQGVFPEPFLVDDSDLERNEVRLDWLHTAVGAAHSDTAKAELEKGFGPATVELAVPYERNWDDGVTEKGFANIELGARSPFYQFVSENGLVDSTFGVGLELSLPTTSEVSHDTELVPKIFNDLSIGNFTLQSLFGYSMLYGPEEGGLDTFEYGFTFGYGIPHQTLPLPGVEKLVPVFELSGETPLNHDNAGQNSLTAGVGLRANLRTFWGVQARPGIVFVFPVDNGARADTHWGIMTSLVFEF